MTKTISAQSLLTRELLARRRPGYSLEAPFYLSDTVLKADMEHIFGKHWIFVAVEPQVPEAGDYITVDFGTNSILIVRDDDNQVQAFHNVCRHRGSRLCASQQGVVGNIVCPYHQWTYDLSGKLIHAKHMGDALRPQPPQPQKSACAQHGRTDLHLPGREPA